MIGVVFLLNLLDYTFESLMHVRNTFVYFKLNFYIVVFCADFVAYNILRKPSKLFTKLSLFRNVSYIIRVYCINHSLESIWV